MFLSTTKEFSLWHLSAHTIFVQHLKSLKNYIWFGRGCPSEIIPTTYCIGQQITPNRLETTGSGPPYQIFQFLELEHQKMCKNNLKYPYFLDLILSAFDILQFLFKLAFFLEKSGFSAENWPKNWSKEGPQRYFLLFQAS